MCALVRNNDLDNGELLLKGSAKESATKCEEKKGE